MKTRNYWLLVALCCPLAAQTINPKPVRELGAPRLTATADSPLNVDTQNPNWVEGKEMYSPSAVAIDNSINPPGIWVSDTRNNPILGWRDNFVVPGRQADVILGQASPYQTLAGGPGTSNSLGLNGPTGIVVDPAGNLYVADSNNNRILRFPSPFANSLKQTAPISPDLVLGQSNFTTNGANQSGLSASSLSLGGTGAVPLFCGLVFDSAGALYVADVNNNRVLVFPANVLKSQNNGPSANLVLGQINFTSAVAAVSPIAAAALAAPGPMAIDLKGRLYIGDSLGRVLVFLPPFIVGINAARVVGIQTQLFGQPPPPPISNTTVGYPQGLTIAGSRLVVSDVIDSRVLVFDPYENWPDPAITLSPAAYEIIGQNGYSDHSQNRGTFVPSAATLSFPLGAAASSTDLFVADAGNNRITVYPIQAGLPQTLASRVIGQGFPNVNAPNIIEGREFNLIASSGAIGSIVIDRSSTPPHLYVADAGNNRILCFKDASNVKAGDMADLIIGQANGLTSLANFPGGDPAKPSSTSLNAPAGLALDSAGNLWVADSGNARVLRFATPFGQSGANLPGANLVIGQTSFTAQFTDASATSLRAPVSLVFTSDGSLLVADSGQNRILYYPQPLKTGMAATKVIGQTDFFSTSQNGTPADPARFNTPIGIAVDAQDRLYVCDAGGGRVAIFGPPSLLQATGAPPVFSLNHNLRQPVALAIGPSTAQTPGEVWVADALQNALVHFPPFAQLSQNSVPDSGFPVITPLGIAYDAFNNLVVADNTNRVLFYVPLVSVVNAANYLRRAVAPGSIVSIFPAPANSGNVLGTTTANFTSLANPVPLPTLLGDTQVLVNQQPAGLFYVSPTQINLPLSLSLPSSGTVNIRVVSKSTGQIYGETDLNMTPVAPGLFTLNSSGTGQLSALNEDNTVNGPGNPLTRGHVIQLFGTGQGLVTGGPPDGMVDTGLAPALIRPQVQISTITVPDENILYSGLAPGLIGVWQINILVPTTITAGNALPVIVTLNSVPANDPSGIKATISLQ